MLTTPVPDAGVRARALAAPTDATAPEDAEPVLAVPAAAPVIALEDVARRYGAVEALVDVNLRIAPGEFVVVLGPSGSGKTTLLTRSRTARRASGEAVHGLWCRHQPRG